MKHQPPSSQCGWRLGQQKDKLLFGVVGQRQDPSSTEEQRERIRVVLTFFSSLLPQSLPSYTYPFFFFKKVKIIRNSSKKMMKMIIND